MGRHDDDEWRQHVAALVIVALGICLSIAVYALADSGWWNAGSGGLHDLAPSGEQPRRAVGG